MAKVLFTHRSGRQQAMDERFAKVLSDMKRGTYQRRDMVAERVRPAAPPAPAPTIPIPPPMPDVDAAGEVYNPEIHSALREKKVDGTWKKRPGRPFETKDAD